MLYVTTRSNGEIYTPNRALRESRAPDGGLYVPFREPEYTREELMALAELPFSQRMAELLSRMFRTKISGWDIDFAIGRYPVRFASMSHRIIIGECWHNPGWSLDWMVKRLSRLLGGDVQQPEEYGEWPEIGVRIAVLFSIFGELLKNGEVSLSAPVDVAVTSGDLSSAMAVVYARNWGLPICNLVICCNENASLWDLYSRGELKTGAVAVKTATPLCDQVVPRNLERLIYSAGGALEVARFRSIWEKGRVYAPNDGVLAPLRKGVHVSVVSEKRMLSAIPNLYRTAQYIAGPYTALCHSGVQDYRARTGENRPALVFSQRSPGQDGALVAMAMGLTPEELEKRMKNG